MIAERREKIMNTCEALYEILPLEDCYPYSYRELTDVVKKGAKRERPLRHQAHRSPSVRLSNDLYQRAGKVVVLVENHVYLL